MQIPAQIQMMFRSGTLQIQFPDNETAMVEFDTLMSAITDGKKSHIIVSPIGTTLVIIPEIVSCAITRSQTVIQAGGGMPLISARQ